MLRASCDVLRQAALLRCLDTSNSPDFPANGGEPTTHHNKPSHTQRWQEANEMEETLGMLVRCEILICEARRHHDHR